MQESADLADIYLCYSSQLVLIYVMYVFSVASFCISALGCVIHPQVFERFGVPSCPALPVDIEPPNTQEAQHGRH